MRQLNLAIRRWPLAAVFFVTTSAHAEPLTLDAVLRQVAENHPKLKAMGIERATAASKLQSKRGAFDPVVTFDADSYRYNSSSVPGKAYETTLSETTVEVLTRAGVKVFGGYRLNSGKVKSPWSSTGSAGETFAGVKLPLLRGREINEKAIAEAQAALGEPLADLNTATIRFELFFKAATSYWEWVAGAQKLVIAKDLHDLAQTRAAGIRERVRLGDAPEIDAIEAETEVQRRAGGLVKAERDERKAALKLSLSRWLPESEAPPLPAPLDAPAFPNAPAVPDSNAGKAVERRPEFAALEIARSVLELQLKLARNDRQPNFELVLSPGIDAGTRSIGLTWKAGLLFSVPLRQNSADGQIAEAQQKLQKLGQEQRLLRRQIEIEVSDAQNAVETTGRRLEAARAELDLARRLERAERSRFVLGEGTIFLLNQRERGTAEAASRVVDVQAELETARAALAAATAELGPTETF